ncbi:hypothetical protein VTK26DRAFT_2616 [Humicola hyalothermophila]
MAVEAATQALVAAFFFGIVLNAASAAVAHYTKSYGAAVFRDSQRLALVLFLLSSALWAVSDFITILVDVTSSSTSCQIGVIFSTVFDQFARFSIEQFLLWAINTNDGSKTPVTQLIPQLAILIRFLAGAVFTGFARPQTDTFCVATSSLLPLGILVPALDAAIIVLLVIRAYSAGRVAKENRDGKGVEASRARALMSVLLGLSIWTGTSVPLLLGIRSIDLAIRTALPAGGLLVVIVILSASAGTLFMTRSPSRPPEAPSPRRINISRDISTSNSEYPPSRYEDLKEAAIRSSTTFVNPREAPRIKDETSVGFAAGTAREILPLPGTIAPSSTLARNLERSDIQKSRHFHFGKGTKMTISNPILQENSAQNLLNKIAVMNLEDAAVAERERRARVYRDSSSGVTRLDAPSSRMSPEEGLNRAVSLKRKEVASAALRQNAVPGAPEPHDVGLALTTSSVQLSPCGEETRRRSPRPSIHETEEEQPPSEDRPLTALPQVISERPRTKVDIRPSRMLPPSPKAAPPEPTKTPLQRRPTVGLPTNPRAQGVKVSSVPGSQHKTVLFVNNIEYNDPLVVQAIIKGTNDKAIKPVPALERSKTTASVVNRPRPIPRKPAESPAASPLPSHRRSRSAGSLGRASFLTPAQGSPSQLPPLPPLPKIVTAAPRPFPNDTKSMTFDEKITLLFPSPPSGTAAKRRSSLPEIPAIPASYPHSETSATELAPRSNRTTKTSLPTGSIVEVYEIPRKPGKTFVNTSHEAEASWLRAFGTAGDGARPVNQQTATQVSKKRGSSPIIPTDTVRASAWTETTYERTEDYATTSGSPAQSTEFGTGVPVEQSICQASSIRVLDRQRARESSGNVSVADSCDSKAVPIMLDISTVQTAAPPERHFPEGESVATPQQTVQNQWHRRVGDECPTFSGKARARKMPPPAPLLLNATRTKKTTAVQLEPFPLDSPGQALQKIQAQLKNLDLPQQSTPQSASTRLALLESLEREMGEQAEHWQDIRHDFDRDSMSSTQTLLSPSKGSARQSFTARVKPTEAGEPSVRSSIGTERRASRFSHMRTEASSVRDSASPQLSKWQKRLTEAQMEYMDAQLLRNSNFNLLQLSRAQIASPTPPDSDQSDRSDSEVPPIPSPFAKAVAGLPTPERSKPASLWKPAPTESITSTGFLWTPVGKPASETDAPLPGLFVRPAQRKGLAPLQIESSQLWRKPHKVNNRSTTGLWRPAWASAAPPVDPERLSSGTASRSQKPPRPLTQRPPRRNKRVTMLPDILESPKPLPDKQGSLGIFQFPWGERSDTASIQPQATMFAAMPGTMTSGGPSVGVAMGAQAKKPEPTEYSSSFFDDYEDEDSDASCSDEDDNDDGFDDSTLWEIASLLQTDAVPSRDSLLPPRPSSAVDDYIDELLSDEESQSSREQSIVIGLAEPREQLLFEQPRKLDAEKATVPLILENASRPKVPSSTPGVMVGLPANPRPAVIPQTSVGDISSKAEPNPTPASTPLWNPSQVPRRAANAQTVETAGKQGPIGLWTPPCKVAEPLSSGPLFVLTSSRPASRGTSEEPAAKHVSREPRPADLKPLDKLTSSTLWSREDATRHRERVWILGEPTLRGPEGNSAATVETAGKQGWIGLWTPPRKVDNPYPRGGLFMPRASRPSYRSTFEEPAAKHVSRKPRPADLKPLDKLTSTALWAPERVVRSPERFWILGETKKSPGSDSIPTIETADGSSALWIPPHKVDSPIPLGGLFVLRPSRASYRSTSEEPAAKHMSRRPRPADLKPLEKLQSVALWTPEGLVRVPERVWILGEPALKRPGGNSLPTRPYLRPQFNSQDWEAALQEAISASYPVNTKANQIAATPSEWKAALQEAISLSARSSAPQPASEKGPLVPPAPAKTQSQRDAIQAQIEALEQERLFAQRFAQEDYRRRISRQSYGYSASAAPELLPASTETVEDLQRHLSQQIRQSLVFSAALNPFNKAEASAMPAKKTEGTAESLPSSSQPKTTTEMMPSAQQPPSGHPLLWTPAPPPTNLSSSSSSSSSSPSSIGLWTAANTLIPSSADSSSSTLATHEDAEARARRARARKAMQKRRQRAEILAQTAAVEAGRNPFVAFEGQEGLWSSRAGASVGVSVSGRVRGGRDWLGSVNMGVKSRGVVLRY